VSYLTATLDAEKEGGKGRRGKKRKEKGKELTLYPPHYHLPNHDWKGTRARERKGERGKKRRKNEHFPILTFSVPSPSNRKEEEERKKKKKGEGKGRGKRGEALRRSTIFSLLSPLPQLHVEVRGRGGKKKKRKKRRGGMHRPAPILGTGSVAPPPRGGRHKGTR